MPRELIWLAIVLNANGRQANIQESRILSRPHANRTGKSLRQALLAIELELQGRSEAGWKVYRNDGKQPPTPWAVDADRKVVIARAFGQPGGGHSWLETTKTFGDFELSLEWRFPPGASVGVNGSGVVILANGLNAINFDPKGVEIDMRTTRDQELGIGNGPHAKRIDVVVVKGVSQIGFCVKTPTGRTTKIAFMVVRS